LIKIKSILLVAIIVLTYTTKGISEEDSLAECSKGSNSKSEYLTPGENCFSTPHKGMPTDQKVNGKSDPVNQLEAFKTIIVSEIKTGKYADAINHCKQADVLAIQLNDIETHVDLMVYTGNIYQSTGLSFRAIDYYLQALNVAKQSEFLRKEGDIYYYLGSVYADINELKKCRENLFASILKLEEFNDDRRILKSYILLSNINYDIDSIAKYLVKAEEIIEKNETLKFEKVTLLNNQALINKAMGNLKLSKSKYLEAITIAKQNNFNNFLANLYNNYAYQLMSESNSDSVNLVLGIAIKLAKELNDLDLEASIYDSYSDYHAFINDFKMSLAYKDTSIALRDEYRNKQRIKESLLLSAVFESETKENELLQQENQITRLWIFAIGFLAFFIAAFAFGLYYRQKLTLSKSKLEAFEKGKALELAEALIKGQDVERKRLAMDLHDGPVASIGTLRFMVDAHFRNYNKYDEITDCILSINKQVREISHRMLPTHLREQGLLKTLENMIENVNKSGKFTADFESNIKGRLSDKLEINIYYLIFELINNAIKHSNGKSIFVQLIEQDQGINLSVEDDGQGFDQTKGHNGMGLKNIKTRIEYLGGKLEISSENQCTLFLIEIPLGNL